MKKLIILILITISSNTYSQVAGNSYRVFFTDKNNNGFSTNHPEEFLSQRAIDRRENQNIEILENDLPITKAYTDSLKKLGCQIINQSKWFNSVVIYTTNQELIDTITQLGFVKAKQKKFAKTNINALKSVYKRNSNMITFNANSLNYGYATNQISMLNGHILHQNNYLGQGMQIAVIDAGFYNVDMLPAFDSLRNNNQIMGVRDFVDGDTYAYDASDHGMKVLSIMGGNMPGDMIGTAPKANYWLLRSENEVSEYAIEEDNWVAAAEFADSAGVDIINTSLGYTIFDDTNQSYSYSDLDGNTAFITRAADIAASKGIIVICSAGNHGNDPWGYISAPADGDSVLTVGAVDKYATYADFSSKGPTYDGRIKPDVVAQGYQTALQGIDGAVTYGNGTSFSAPVIAGLTACLWQSMPDYTNIEIIQKIKESAHQFSAPSNFLGYGVPDFAKAANLTNSESGLNTNNVSLNIYPNPFTDYIHIDITIPVAEKITIEIIDIIGQKVRQKKTIAITKSHQIELNNLHGLNPGVYFLNIKTDNLTISKKISKM